MQRHSRTVSSPSCGTGQRTPSAAPAAPRRRGVGAFPILRGLDAAARGGRTAAVLLSLLAASRPADSHLPAEEPRSPSELKELALEELFDLEVVSVSKKPEKLIETPAAVSVVTNEDLRRTGVESLPEALRRIPGVEVARVDSRQYAITIRGFNSTTANKLLVLMDGRSLYTPLYSGVFWDAQDTLLEDVERIEVIRGPGATVWGANAVNGVVNVITKDAAATQGLFVSAGGGAGERAFVAGRYGGSLGSIGHYRVWAKGFSRDESLLPDGRDAGDRYRMAQGGIRVDLAPRDDRSIHLQANVSGGDVGQPAADDVTFRGGHLLGRWVERLRGGSELELQFYWDRTERTIPAIFGETLDTFDVELRHRDRWHARNDVVWGIGYRRMHDQVENSPTLAFLPPRVTRELATAFLQNETALGPAVRLTIGLKVEHNDDTGFEWEPGARLAWIVGRDQTLWAAATRAVRAPSRIDRELYSPAEPPYLLAGGPTFRSEKVDVYEIGWKARPAETVSASVSVFYDVYHDLRSLEGGPPYTIGNGLEGSGHGIEVDAGCEPRPGWRLEAGVSWLDLDLERKPGSTDVSQVLQAGDSPDHSAFLRSSLDLPRGWSLDATVRRVDELPRHEVPGYVAVDLRIGWTWRDELELSVVGTNLSDRRHPEFGSAATRREIGRGVHGKVTWRF